VSLLLSEGHADARRYPVAFAWSEARIVRQRNAFRRKEETALLQLAVGSILDKKAGKELAKLIERMDESD
jgi:hypothetical protein